MKKIAVVLLSTVVCGTLASAKIVQTFEPAKDTSAFTAPVIGWNADLTFNYQGLSHEYDLFGKTGEAPLQAGLSLPTANFDITAKVLSGFNVRLETMFSSHHHNETYVKGGYATIDNLDFIDPGFGSSFMKNATLKVGVDDINFGDDHYRRSDNADVMRNPFIHNMGVEAYMQAPHLEVLYRLPPNTFALLGITNGQVNPDDVLEKQGSNRPGVYGKIGYDAQLNDALRLRVSESVYYVKGTNKGSSLFSGDKAGTVSRKIFDDGTDGDFGSLWNAMSGFSDLTLSHTNLFLKYNDTEFYAMYEMGDGANITGADMKLNHYAVDLVQRFANDKFFAAARYENAVVKYADPSNDLGDAKLTQYQLGLGWFLSKNAVAKLEYINQKRENNSAFVGGTAEFKGYMISTALSF